METIFKAGYKKIMKVFYENKNSKIHLREIARRTKMNENSVSRFLNQLEKQEILKSKKEANLKKYFIVKNKKTFSLFILFDVYRLESLPKIRQRAINYFLKELDVLPIIVILFGSSAKMNYKNDSDIDLLLIVNEKIKVSKSEKNSEAQTGLKISAIQISYKDFKKELKNKEDEVIQSAINSGYPLTNHIMYYEEVLK